MPSPTASAAAFQNMQSAHDNVAEIKDKLDALQQAMDWKVQELGLAKGRMTAELERHNLQIVALNEMNERQLPRIDVIEDRQMRTAQVNVDMQMALSEVEAKISAPAPPGIDVQPPPLHINIGTPS